MREGILTRMMKRLRFLKEITEGLVLLYDPYQGIKPQNISPSEVRRLTSNYQKLSMSQQFRIGGNGCFSGEDYLKRNFVWSSVKRRKRF